MGDTTITNNLVVDEVAHTPHDTTAIVASHRGGFRVGGAGDVSFRYVNGTVTFTRTYAAGDEVFGAIEYIYSTATTATSITVFRLQH